MPRYYTGDLGSVADDRAFVSLGRIDRQAKIRGFRVEPTEVEQILPGQPGVGATRVTARAARLLPRQVAAARSPRESPPTMLGISWQCVARRRPLARRWDTEGAS